MLKNVNFYEDGWKDIIQTHNKHNLCTNKDIIKLDNNLWYCANHI